MSAKMPRLPRIERSKSAHVEDETSHLWAVSYADFLMVLLSFFIIFFTFEKKKQNSAIDEIVAYSKKVVAGESFAVPPRGPASSTNAAAALAPALTSLDKLKVETARDAKSLYIHLPDNIYRKGSAKLDADVTPQFEALIKVLAVFNGKIKITFIGHTDESRLVSQNYPGVNDNFDLSALRASSALRHALRMGLDAKTLFLSGSAENKRNSRTLSIFIEEEGLK